MYILAASLYSLNFEAEHSGYITKSFKLPFKIQFLYLKKHVCVKKTLYKNNILYLNQNRCIKNIILYVSFEKNHLYKKHVCI